MKGLLIACFQTLKSTGGWGIFKWPQVGDFGWPPGRYTAERNIGKNIREEDKRATAKKEFEKMADWLTVHGSSLKIAIWDIIYNNR